MRSRAVTLTTTSSVLERIVKPGLSACPAACPTAGAVIVLLRNKASNRRSNVREWLESIGLGLLRFKYLTLAVLFNLLNLHLRIETAP